MIYPLLRPILFGLDPERAHALSLHAVRWTGAIAPLRLAVRKSLDAPAGTPVKLFGLEFPNAVGLAAGYDKDGTAWRGLACLGFGHVEIGTVTPRPQPGNPRPRVFRLAEDRSLINRLGFPSRGADFVVKRLAGKRPPGLIVGVNVGKQKETPLTHAADDYEYLVDRFAALADYLAINISSPNTPELRKLQQREWLGPLLERVIARRDRHSAVLGRRLPVLLKLAPDLDEADLEPMLEAIVASGVDGIIAANTTVARPDGLRSPHAAETGGLSGAALGDRSLQLLVTIHRIVAGRLPIVSCGGVMGADDAQARIAAGASLVQLYTGLVFGGPSLVGRIIAGIQAVPGPPGTIE